MANHWYQNRPWRETAFQQFPVENKNDKDIDETVIVKRALKVLKKEEIMRNAAQLLSQMMDYYKEYQESPQDWFDPHRFLTPKQEFSTVNMNPTVGLNEHKQQTMKLTVPENTQGDINIEDQAGSEDHLASMTVIDAKAAVITDAATAAVNTAVATTAAVTEPVPKKMSHNINKMGLKAIRTFYREKYKKSIQSSWNDELT